MDSGKGSYTGSPNGYAPGDMLFAPIADADHNGIDDRAEQQAGVVETYLLHRNAARDRIMRQLDQINEQQLRSQLRRMGTGDKVSAVSSSKRAMSAASAMSSSAATDAEDSTGDWAEAKSSFGVAASAAHAHDATADGDKGAVTDALDDDAGHVKCLVSSTTSSAGKDGADDTPASWAASHDDAREDDGYDVDDDGELEP